MQPVVASVSRTARAALGELRRGDRVSVKLAPGYEDRGSVDAISGDHSIVWVNLDGGRGRTLVHCADGVEIVRHEG